MKKFKKIMAVLVAAMMIMATMAPAWAAANEYVITINNALFNETYSAYKIFSLSDSASSNITYVSAQGETVDTETTYYSQVRDPKTGAVTYEKANPQPTTGTIEGLYKLRTGVAYTIRNDGDKWYNVVNAYPADGTKGLKLTQAGGDTHLFVVTFDEDTFDAANFAAYLKNKLDLSITAHAQDSNNALLDTPVSTGINTTTNPGNDVSPGTATVTIDVGAAGYYLVDTTLGAIAALDTASKTITMNEKNTCPTIKKEISKDGSTFGIADINVNEGDTVNYKLTVTDGRGTDNELTVHDTLQAGLTLTKGFTIQTVDKSAPIADPATVTVSPDKYKIKYKAAGKINPALVAADISSGAPADECSFEIVFDKSVIAGLEETDEIVITYSGVLNAAANIYHSVGKKTNDNTAWLTYSGQKSAPQTVKARTYEFRVIKKDSKSGNGLGGVVFTLKNSSGKYYKRATDTTTDGATTTTATWFDDEQTVESAASTGYIDFIGLEAGTYTLTEKTAAPGYNPLTDTVTITVSSEGVVTAAATNSTTDVVSASVTAGDGTIAESKTPANFDVYNTPGTALPSTGGMGTTVLYIVGGMLVILAGAYLFFSRKKTA